MSTPFITIWSAPELLVSHWARWRTPIASNISFGCIVKVFSCIKTQQNKSRITHDIVNVLSQICCFYISKLNFAFEMSNIFRNTFEDDLYLTLRQGTTLSSKTMLNQVNVKIEKQFQTFVSVVFLIVCCRNSRSTNDQTKTPSAWICESITSILF